ncbi:3-dehydroquinate synthase [Luteimonas yindakuii]|nr:3-dehydroquinate synthase [Luteimonas yindakuii]
MRDAHHGSGPDRAAAWIPGAVAGSRPYHGLLMNPAPNLVLVGPMGAGKSSIGRRLAGRFGLAFVDLDREVEQRTGATIPTIFECEGESGFRVREREVLLDLLAGEGLLLASGGGAVLDPANRRAMAARAFVVHLHVELAEQLERLGRDRTRPLLANGDREQVLRALATVREPLYRDVADLRFDTGGCAPPVAVARLGRLLDQRWQRAPFQPLPASAPTTPDDLHMQRSSRTVDVGGATPYPIRIGPGLLDDGALLAGPLRGRQALLVSDSEVAPRYAARVASALKRARPDLAIGEFVLPSGEASKTLDGFSGAIDALAALGARRDACVYALGGGVVGDLAGFAAACWMRGVDCVQLPTSLLAMVDSSVGGKTAVDLPQGKNLVGAFHPPRAVIADTTVLATLPARELRAGLAEVVKYGALGDAAFLDWLDAHADALLAMDHEALAEAIVRSCAHKAAIVERDPHEHGERALLNFGHTFAHAIETAQGYGGLNHGEAVAVGMVLAARLSEALGLAPAADGDRLRALLERFGLPVDLPAALDPEQLLAHMRLDKKAQAGGLRFIVWRGAGRAEVLSDVPESAVLAVLRAN